MSDLFGKADTSVATVTERAKPMLVSIGNRQVIPNGRWNDRLMADFVLERGRDKWIKIGRLATLLGANTIPNKKRVRARLPRLFLELLNRGFLLAVEYSGEYGAATAVKIANLTSEHDRQNVVARLERMRKRKELTTAQYDKTMRLIWALQEEA